MRCPLHVQVETGNRTDRSADQERGYERAKRTKTKSQASRLSTAQKGLSRGSEKLNTCSQNRGRKERKYGNPERTPPAPAVPKHQAIAGRGEGAGYPGALGRDPRGPGLRTHASGTGRGLLGLGGGSSPRSGFLLPATVLTRFLESPSDIYLTS